MSASEILDEMLSAMPESYQKTIGFPTYDLLAAVSLRMEGTDTTIDEAKQQLDPENLSGDDLDRYIYPRSGLARKASTFAHGTLTVTGSGTVEIGTLFESGGGVQYYATETVAIEGEGTVPVTCTVDGTAGNLPAHSVTQMPVTMQGIASCDNPEPIGGGYAAMPMIQAKAVEYYHWLTMGEFTDLMTIAEMTPGPITVNSATFVGIRMAGIPGALVATMGCILPSLIIVSLLSWLYEKYRSMDAMQAVLACLRPAVVALIASAALTILRVVVFAGGVISAETVQMLYVALFAAALVVLRVKHSNPILVMVCCGAVSLIAKFIAG